MEAVLDTSQLVARSKAMRELLRQIDLVRDSAVAVLLSGEPGSGKQMVAREIHRGGARRREPIVHVDCGAAPAEVLERSVFGGADAGRLEAARNGTIYLSRIDHLSLSLQERVLRMLERSTIERGGRIVPVRARLVVSTSGDLRVLVQRGTFREDLFYRLNLFPIDVPPLRRRREDVAVLANLFLQRYRNERTPPARGIDKRCMAALEDYPWPGNARELEETILRAIPAAGDDGILQVEALPKSIQDRAPEAVEEETPPVAYSLPSERDVIVPLKELERRAIQHALRVTGGNVTRAARALGIGRATMYRKLERFKMVTS